MSQPTTARRPPKVLLISTYLHKKNFQAITKYKNIDFDIVENPQLIQNINFHKYQYVYSPAILIDPRRFPHTKFIFGPHVSVFPTTNISRALSGLKNVVYVQPSEWARKAWVDTGICNFPIEVLPFGVDIDRFCPGVQPPPAEEINIFIYYKRRHPAELAAIQKEIDQWCAGGTPRPEVRLFDYVAGYEENDYLAFLKKATFGIWIGSHESQGFALEEALACNVPILVWDATKMSQEYEKKNYVNGKKVGGHPDVPCTTTPYWDERCGEKFTMFYEFRTAFSRFLDKLEDYRPREFILENLTPEKCEEKMIQIFSSPQSAP
jgi:glycosyltransferase involved in cell wall biosynthesis